MVDDNKFFDRNNVKNDSLGNLPPLKFGITNRHGSNVGKPSLSAEERPGPPPSMNNPPASTQTSPSSHPQAPVQPQK